MNVTLMSEAGLEQIVVKLKGRLLEAGCHCMSPADYFHVDILVQICQKMYFLKRSL